MEMKRNFMVDKQSNKWNSRWRWAAWDMKHLTKEGRKEMKIMIFICLYQIDNYCLYFGNQAQQTGNLQTLALSCVTRFIWSSCQSILQRHFPHQMCDANDCCSPIRVFEQYVHTYCIYICPKMYFFAKTMYFSDVFRYCYNGECIRSQKNESLITTWKRRATLHIFLRL